MSLLKGIYSSSFFRENGHLLVDMMADYLERIEKNELKTVYPYKTAEQSYEYWQNEFDNKELSIEEFFAKTIEMSNHLHHPNYMGHQVSPPAPIAALTGMLTGLLNNGGAIYEMGIVNNPMEKVLSNFLGKKLGYDNNCGGFLTSGGTLANLTALLAARAKHSEVWKKGTTTQLAIMVSEEAHYCVDRAARIMGLGDEGIIKVKTNAKFQMEISKLETALKEAQLKNITVFAIVGSACSTSTGSYDDLEAISKFAGNNNLWFHVDGAHGGAAVFSKKYAYLVKGIEKSDSVTMDWHKMLLTPALNTHLMFKNETDSFRTFQQKAQYLWDTSNEIDRFNLGKRTFECTKLMMPLKVYSIFKAHGEEVFEENFEYLYTLARQFAEIIKLNQLFELGHEPEANIVCFRVIKPKAGYSLNSINSLIRTELLKNGSFYIVQTNLSEDVFLRVSLMNPTTSIYNLDNLLSKIEDIFINLI